MIFKATLYLQKERILSARMAQLGGKPSFGRLKFSPDLISPRWVVSSAQEPINRCLTDIVAAGNATLRSAFGNALCGFPLLVRGQAWFSAELSRP